MGLGATPCSAGAIMCWELLSVMLMGPYSECWDGTGVNHKQGKWVSPVPFLCPLTTFNTGVLYWKIKPISEVQETSIHL